MTKPVRVARRRWEVESEWEWLDRLPRPPPPPPPLPRPGPGWRSFDQWVAEHEAARRVNEYLERLVRLAR